jgi:diacylglycerol kinase (ATP)
MHNLFKVFSFAFNGIAYGLRTQRNIRIQFGIFLLVSIIAFLVHFSLREYIVILICSAMVLCAEILNTAIEVLVDLVSPEWNEKAGLVKDLAASAVLVVSIFSAVIGVLVFLRHFAVL